MYVSTIDYDLWIFSNLAPIHKYYSCNNSGRAQDRATLVTNILLLVQDVSILAKIYSNLAYGHDSQDLELSVSVVV